ncbi:imidazole glycerol phosphate synthase subunit HisH [bacterium]|nr:imidazole glycerol phosphate synthase subunit HisH [bacterium]
MNIVIIEYNGGNTRSVQFALQRIGFPKTVISDDPTVILQADRVIFPGVGEASSAMRRLRSLRIDRIIPDLKQPVLGICLGMQLLCSGSAEGETPCLGIFPDMVRRFPADKKVPHIGWARIRHADSPLFRGIAQDEWFYFVHSYCVPVNPGTSSVCRHGVAFSAAMQKDNYTGCQFHPEKSGSAGERFLTNFIKGDV